MKRHSHVVLAALVALSFGLSALLVSGALRAWGASAELETLAAMVTRAHPRPAALVCDAAMRQGAAGAGANTGFYSDTMDGQPYALVEPGHDGGVMIEADGWHPDVAELTRNDPRPLLWFVRDGDEWVSRDPDVIAKARAIVAPSRANGEAMGAIGGQLGARGAKAGALGGRMGALTGRLASLEVRRTFSAASEDERAGMRREAEALRAEMSRMQAQMHDANTGDMPQLRERLRELSRKQAELSRVARAQMRTLIDSVIRERKADRLGIGV